MANSFPQSLEMIEIATKSNNSETVDLRNFPTERLDLKKQSRPNETWPVVPCSLSKAVSFREDMLIIDFTSNFASSPCNRILLMQTSHFRRNESAVRNTVCGVVNEWPKLHFSYNTKYIQFWLSIILSFTWYWIIFANVFLCFFLLFFYSLSLSPVHFVSI